MHVRVSRSAGVWVSADVFGLTLYVKDDLGIGQKIEKVSSNVDIVCPMIYPSHYYAGSYNQKNPNSHPYEIITAAMKDSTKRLRGTGAIVRPWLQDFSLGGVTYGVEQVKAQIKAVEEQGYTEWLLWDPSLKYTEGALRPRVDFRLRCGRAGDRGSGLPRRNPGSGCNARIPARSCGAGRLCLHAGNPGRRRTARRR